MRTIDQIAELSALPSRYNIMLENALRVVSNDSDKNNLCAVACTVASATWQHWQSWRTPEDNRQEHEWIVFANVMRIAEAEELSLRERRIATAFCFVHDTFFIRRIMDAEIEKLRKMGREDEVKELERRKKTQREDHMKGGAANARFLLPQLQDPYDPTKPLLDCDEIERCAAIVENHDSWKVDPPVPPHSADRLMLACVEGDVLWPLHPVGVLADLERPDKSGNYDSLFDTSKWREKLQGSIDTVVKYRKEWAKLGQISNDDFFDDETIFRTKEGYTIFSEWKNFWNPLISQLPGEQ